MRLSDFDIPVLQYWSQGLSRALRMHLLIDKDANEI
jgi:hypothetical protein